MQNKPRLLSYLLAIFPLVAFLATALVVQPAWLLDLSLADCLVLGAIGGASVGLWAYMVDGFLRPLFGRNHGTEMAGVRARVVKLHVVGGRTDRTK